MSLHSVPHLLSDGVLLQYAYYRKCLLLYAFHCVQYAMHICRGYSMWLMNCLWSRPAGLFCLTPCSDLTLQLLRGTWTSMADRTTWITALTPLPTRRERGGRWEQSPTCRPGERCLTGGEAFTLWDVVWHNGSCGVFMEWIFYSLVWYWHWRLSHPFSIDSHVARSRRAVIIAGFSGKNLLIQA